MNANKFSDIYEGGEQIGGGGFGRIFRARHRLNNNILAYKTVSWGSMEPRMKQILRDEIQLLTAIKHPNIVEYKEAFDDGDAVVNIVMEYCNQGDLKQYIQRASAEKTMIGEGQIWSILEQLTSALFRCHNGFNHAEDLAGPKSNDLCIDGIRFLHRDLKPENVFIDNHGTIKLGDFGFCGVLGPGEIMRLTFLGTHAYMSPELIKNEPYTAKSDTWGLGCIIHELATLDTTFSPNGLSTDETSIRIKNGWYHPVNPNAYSDELQNVIKKCLHIDPNKRPGMCELVKNYRVIIARKERQLDIMRRNWEVTRLLKDNENEKEFQRRWIFLQSKHQEATNEVKNQEGLLRDRIAQLDSKEGAMLPEIGKTPSKRRAKIAGENLDKMAASTLASPQRDSSTRQSRKKVWQIKNSRLIVRDKAQTKKQQELDERESLLSIAEAALATAESIDYKKFKQRALDEFQRKLDAEVTKAVKTKVNIKDIEASLIDDDEEETDIDETDGSPSELTLTGSFSSASFTGASNLQMSIGESFYDNHRLLPFAEQRRRARETAAGYDSGPMDIGETFYEANGLPV